MWSKRSELARARFAILPSLLTALLAARESSTASQPREPLDPALVAEGREIFRYDTFGDEAYWTDTLRLHDVVESAVSPRTALAVGLKVDVDALPASVRQAIVAGAVDLDDPATTLALLQLNAVVGLQGEVETIDGKPRLTRLGITCALCHSTVDNSFAPGIGRRMDGWANRGHADARAGQLQRPAARHLDRENARSGDPEARCSLGIPVQSGAAPAAGGQLRRYGSGSRESRFHWRGAMRCLP